MTKQVDPRHVSTSVSDIAPLDLSDLTPEGEFPPLFSPPPITKCRTNNSIVRGLPFSYVRLNEPRHLSASVSDIEPLDISDWSRENEMEALFSPRPDTKNVRREFTVSSRKRYKQHICVEIHPELSSRTEEIKCYRNSSDSLEFDSYNWFSSTLNYKPKLRTKSHISTMYIGPKVAEATFMSAMKHRVNAPEKRRWSVSEVFLEATVKKGGVETKHLGSWDATYGIDEETDLVEPSAFKAGRMRKNPQVHTRAASVH